MKKILIDEKLTPKNAQESGYEYVRNIVYDPSAPKETNKEIKDLIKNKGYKLGKGLTDAPDLFCGWYKKIGK